jgi:hypothetical protein
MLGGKEFYPQNLSSMNHDDIVYFAEITLPVVENDSTEGEENRANIQKG